MTDNTKLEKLYNEMYELTLPECKGCRAPLSCCSPEYCDLATMRASEFGVELTPTGHDKLPYMGENGCVVPAYLRPLCTLHTCDVCSIGFKRDDPSGEWTDKYFVLRDQIEQLEAKRMGYEPYRDDESDGQAR